MSGDLLADPAAPLFVYCVQEATVLHKHDEYFEIVIYEFSILTPVTPSECRCSMLHHSGTASVPT
jgi:hypothetical protein